ncbi:MAG: Tm-1-like ATP-binding domain-containing protein [Thermodesulfobacteriota bacterium]
MEAKGAIIVLGTFDSKSEEHLFLRDAVAARGLPALTVNAGTRGESGFSPDYDLRPGPGLSRDAAVSRVIERGRELLAGLHAEGRVAGVVSAGGGTGTHICTGIMKALPLGVPKVMVSTVASRDMSAVVGTKDITMMHSVGDLLGVNSISGLILDQAAGAVCGMARSFWRAKNRKKTIGLTMFGFITAAAEAAKAALEGYGHEVVAFHANGTGGLAMEELALEGRFDGILDLATHELADSLYQGGYCRLNGSGRLEPPGDGPAPPRLVVPGGLDCVVLEFTRDNVPAELGDRRIFFYDFRSAISLSREETLFLAGQLADKINRHPARMKLLSPRGGWSEAASAEGPLHDQGLAAEFMSLLRSRLRPEVEIIESDRHINDPAFAREAARIMNEML